jgi:hypothetical protein
MSPRIHIVSSGGGTAPLLATPFAKEADLQKLVAENPELLAGDQMDAGDALRFLLVKREAGILSTESQDTRWSLDHLFIDQHGTPTLVEVKRGRNSQVRREVVGQVIEYAANCAKSWNAATLRRWFDETHGSQTKIVELLHSTRKSIEADEDRTEASAPAVGDATGASAGSNEIDAFWKSAEDSLRASRIRLVFLADELPPRLIRMIEFLNERFADIEVVGVELRQYSNDDINVLVPRVVGMTSRALDKRQRANPDRVEWEDDSFQDTIQQRHGRAAADAISGIMDWCGKNQVTVGFTTSKSGSFVPEFPLEGKMVWPIAINVDGRVKLQLDHLANRGGGMKSQTAREDLLRRLNGILKVPIGLDRAGAQPSFPISELGAPGALKEFLGIMDWLKQQVLAV